MHNGYEFYFKDGSDVLTFPITPAELSIRVGSNNKVITLINEGDINILKSPSLAEIEFDARFPMRQYPYARQFVEFETYWNKFKDLKENKKSFRFIVARTIAQGNRTWDTNMLVALEDMHLKESADEGDDVIISFKLKQYKAYSVKTIQLPVEDEPEDNPDQSTSTSEESRQSDEVTEPVVYVVKAGDTLCRIAKAMYDDCRKYTVIYNANVEVIEGEAKRRGLASSSNGHWIFVGCELIIPPL